MIKLIYYINANEKESELEWLRELKIYPAVEEHWVSGNLVTMIGAIVSPESALAIKLRHKLQIQTEYAQR